MPIARALPTPLPDSSLAATPTRTDPYGAAYVIAQGADLGPYAEEGSLFIVQTTTPGTGVAGHAAPVAADLSTKPLIHLYNNGALVIVPKWIKVRVTAVGAGATTIDADVYVETGAGATSRASGGTLMSPAINTSSKVAAPVSGATVYFGAVVSTLTSAKRTGHSRIRSVVPVVEDQYLVTFGALAPAAPGGITSGTLVAALYVPMAPVAIQPGHNFQFHLWGVSESGAHSFDLELGYVER
jgi:hypothetical protein